jgi:hypothetical protein
MGVVFYPKGIYYRDLLGPGEPTTHCLGYERVDTNLDGTCFGIIYMK